MIPGQPLISNQSFFVESYVYLFIVALKLTHDNLSAISKDIQFTSVRGSEFYPPLNDMLLKTLEKSLLIDDLKLSDPPDFGAQAENFRENNTFNIKRRLLCMPLIHSRSTPS